MARPKREGDWIPVTTRMDADAARRLRVAAAKRGINMGTLLDELVFEHLPSVEPEKVGSRQAEPTVTVWDIARLGREMESSGISQSDLGRAIGIRPRAISDWFERRKIPPARQQEVQKVIADIRAAKKKAPRQGR